MSKTSMVAITHSIDLLIVQFMFFVAQIIVMMIISLLLFYERTIQLRKATDFAW